MRIKLKRVQEELDKLLKLQDTYRDQGDPRSCYLQERIDYLEGLLERGETYYVD